MTTYCSESFNEPHDEYGDVTDLRCHWREESEDDVDHHRAPNDPLGREHFSHSTARQLRENVTPKVSTEHQPLNRFGPFEWTVLRDGRLIGARFWSWASKLRIRTSDGFVVKIGVPFSASISRQPMMVAVIVAVKQR